MATRSCIVAAPHRTTSTDSFCSSPSDLPESEDGRSINSLALSSALRNSGNFESTYIVDRIGQSPRFIRTDITEARMYTEMGYSVHDLYTHRLIRPDDWVIPLLYTVDAQTEDDAFRCQSEAIDEAVGEMDEFLNGSGEFSDAEILESCSLLIGF
jgi:hypothetical protein